MCVAGVALSTATENGMHYRSRDVTDSPFFWMGFFLMFAVAMFAGDLVDIVTLAARFGVWFAGLM